MANKMRLVVSMPTETVLDTQVDYVLLRTPEGDLGVLHGHEPCAVMLEYGVLRGYVDKKITNTLAVLGGFATVRDNTVVVLTDLAALPDRVDAVMAERDTQRHDNRLRQEKTDLEIQRAERALRRTLVQMDLNPHSILNRENDNVR